MCPDNLHAIGAVTPSRVNKMRDGVCLFFGEPPWGARASAAQLEPPPVRRNIFLTASAGMEMARVPLKETSLHFEVKARF